MAILTLPNVLEPVVKRIERWPRLVGQFLPIHKWCLAVRAYAAEGCAGRFSQYTRSGVHPSSARCGLI